MQQEATDELVSFETSLTIVLCATAIVFPAKGNIAVFEGKQAVVGDGDAVSVAAADKSALASGPPKGGLA